MNDILTQDEIEAKLDRFLTLVTQAYTANFSKDDKAELNKKIRDRKTLGELTSMQRLLVALIECRYNPFNLSNESEVLLDALDMLFMKDSLEAEPLH